MTKALFHLRQFRLLLLFLLCALFSLPLSAREAYVVRSEDQHTLTFYFDNNRRLRSGKIWGIDDKSWESEPAWTETYYDFNKPVTKVVFDASFKDFLPRTTEGWFYCLSELTTIEGLENLNTSAVTDMSWMFYNCSSLTSLNVSNFNTSKVISMSEMFDGCSGLKIIFNTNTWRCEYSYHMFKGCTQLKGAVKYDGINVDVTMANPETGYFSDPNPKAYVQQSEDMQTLTFFYDANRTLRSGKTWDIDEKPRHSIPDWAATYSTSAVTEVVFDASFKDFRPTTTMGWFYDRSFLTIIKGLQNLNTSKVKDMGSMFSGCSNLRSLNLSNFNTSAVTSMAGMFYGCSRLTELNVSNFNTSKVTNMRYMFYGCSGLKELNLSNFNTSKVTDMSYMFSWCTSLTSLNLSNFNTSAVTDMRGMFYGCSGLTALNLSNFNTSAVTDMRGMFYGCSGLTALNLSNFNTSAVTDMREMFRDCSGLTYLNVSSFNTSAVKNMSAMFSGCSGLKRIFNTNTWRCEQSQEMFRGCTQLKGAVKYNESKVDATMANPTTGYFTDPNRNEAYVLQSEDQHTLTFYYDNNRKLRSGKTWDIDEKSSSSEPIWAGTNKDPNKVVTKVVFDASFKDFGPTTTNSWFSYLKALTTIEGLENLNTSAVTDMSAMFYGCSSLTELNLSNLNTSAVTDMSEMFYGCSSLTELNLSNLNTSAVTDMSEMFYGCSSLKRIFNTQTWRCEKSQNMFYGCTQLNGAVKYYERKVDVTMANPTMGYFTDPNREYPKAYVLQSKDQHTLTFYYDNNRKLRSGKTWDIDEQSSSSKPVWAGTYEHRNDVVTKVVFDASFKDFLPRTTNSWFSYLEALTTIEGLENLNTSEVTDMSWMFDGCSRLTSLNLSNFNTSAVTNMREMFSGCSGLTSLNPSKFNTSAVTNMEEMFSGCHGLTSLNLSNFNTSAVKSMRAMFTVCSGLKELNLANFNTSAVTDMNQMFSGCSGLKELNLSNFNTSAVKNMWRMFYNCHGLRSLNVSSFNTSAVTDMREMFSGCSGLKELNVSNFNTSAVTDMIRMFFDCSGLTSLNLSNFNTSAVTDMHETFSGCSGLTSLNLSNFNTSAVTNMRDMFSGCSSLKTIFNTQTWRCEKSQNMFYGCAQLKGAVKYDKSEVDATMANPTTGYFTDPNPQAYVLLSEDQHTITFYYDNNRKLRGGKTWDIDEKSSSSEPAWAGTYNSPNNVVTKVVFDASFKDFRPTTTKLWFYYFEALTTFEGLENLNTSEVTDMSLMFGGCSGLTSLNLSNFNTSKVTDMGAMFSGCSSLKELNVSNFNTSKVTDMSKMFAGCTSLTALNLSNFSTSAVTDMGDMFSGCSGLKELNVSNFNTSKVTDMIRMFSDCSGLKELNLSNFNTSKVISMREMFKNCSGLKELNVSNFNTSNVTDMSEMFRDCSGLKTILNTNTWRCEESQDMFKGCAQLNGAVKYDASKLDVTMANPTTGYFTDPNKKHLEAYVQQSEDKHTLTFFYDVNRTLRSGKTWDIDEQQNASEDGTEKIPAWAGFVLIPNLETTKVVFDASFRNFLPTTTKAWFSSLQILSTIEGIENLNTSAVTDMGYMFSDCSSLKQLNVSNFNTAKVTNMSGMFAVCSSLTSLNLSNFNSSAVTNMSGMFYKCSGLTSLNLSNFNTSAVTNMSLMFSGCSGLTSLNVSNFNTSAVADMSQMFFGCSDLKELNVSNFNTSAVTNMSWMFKNCSGLKELNVSNFNTSAVTDMYEMFRDCSGLKTILNPNTWLCDNSQNMFYGCTLLNGAVNYDASKVDVTMANPTTGYFTDPNREYPKAYVLQSEDQHTLTFYYDNNRKLRSGKTWGIDEKSSSSKPVWAGTYSTANKAVTKVVFDASFKVFRPTTTEGWFYHLSELATIEGLENLNTSAVKDMSAMFFRCSGLTSLNLSNFNTSKVTHMGWMFEGCSKLTSLNLSNFNTSAVTNMIAMFSRCPGLKELNISSFNTSAVKNMSWMFCDCSGLKELNISNFNTSSVTNMSQMFFGSSGLTALNLSNFNTSAVTNMSWMFKNCSGLKELNLSNFNTSAVAYMYEMFRDCSGLKTILNPNTWRFEESHDMFKGCTQLKGAVKYDGSKVDATMANPTTGYFSQKLPSAIGRVVFDGDNATQIYNLQGKRVNANQRHLPAGFYIVNGKKVYLNEKP